MATHSNFKKVVEFMKTFGQEVPDKVNPVYLDKKDLVKLRMGLIDEEVSELREALKEKDLVEVVDALADILYVTYGAAASFGIDMDKVFDMVHRSNMSKACNNGDEASETLNWYIEHPEKGYPNPVIEERGGMYLVKCGETKKVLKSINYSAVTKNLEDYVIRCTCEHRWVKDSIDVDPDRSRSIEYCDKCEETRKDETPVWASLVKNVGVREPVCIDYKGIDDIEISDL